MKSGLSSSRIILGLWLTIVIWADNPSVPMLGGVPRLHADLGPF